MEINARIKLKIRIEKIAQAVYLASNHIKDNEPLKWELRKEGISLLACVRSFGEENGLLEDVSSDLAINTLSDMLSSCAYNLITFLSLSSIAGLMSKNNVDIITHEIRSVLEILGHSPGGNIIKKGFILSEDFFADDPELNKTLGYHINRNRNTDSMLESKSYPRQKGENIKDKKNDRQTRILAILKNQANLTIKDFAKVINDCSEKTIQRELIDLVEKGIVKR